MVLAQGRRWLPLVPSRDYKRIGARTLDPTPAAWAPWLPLPLLGGDLHEEIGARNYRSRSWPPWREAGTPFRACSTPASC